MIWRLTFRHQLNTGLLEIKINIILTRNYKISKCLICLNVFSLKPTIRSKSTIEDVKRCTTKTADLAGNFNVTEARLTVEAFGVSIWSVNVKVCHHLVQK